MVLVWFLLVIVLSVTRITVSLKFMPDPDINLNMEQRVKKQGYPLEIHQVTTEDNYILTIHRIPYGRNSKNTTSKRSPVLLIHGMGARPEYFILWRNSLACYLADNGFDVWMQNNRGTSYSEKHKYYEEKRNIKYWKFSYHEIGVYDIPANIDYIVNKTNDKVFVIGHSQGNTCYFVTVTEKPEYNDKIKIGVVYAPAVLLKYVDYPISVLFSYLVEVFELIYNFFELGVFFPLDNAGASLVQALCSERTYFLQFCRIVLSVIGSHESKLITEEIALKIFSIPLVRVSAMQVFHYMQGIKTGIFRQYDYGEAGNLKKYQSKTPPEYNLTNAIAPVALFHADRDDITSPEEQIIKKHGYPLEIHQVTTEDNYILTIHRIPYGRRSKNTTSKRNPVLLVHGMGGRPEYFITLGRNSLAYYLADNGFDVWIQNSRGTSYSEKHKYYEEKRDVEYWKFSYHQIGIYDIPANIDYIVNKTNNKVFFIGHSQGNTAYFVAVTEKPEYNDKIKIGVVYAPSVFLKYADYPFGNLFSYLVELFEIIYNFFGLGVCFPLDDVGASVVQALCSERTYFLQFCRIMLSVVGSHESKLITEEIALKVFSIPLARISTMQMFHYMQGIKSGIFRQYDYGEVGNLRKYQSKTPPEYNLTNAVAPVALFHADRDDYISSEGIMETIKALPNVILNYRVQYKHFNHIDFLFGKNASALVYKQTAKLFHDFDNGKLEKRNSG